MLAASWGMLAPAPPALRGRWRSRRPAPARAACACRRAGP